ncbi:MAG: DUF1553 domain-containing protein [Planctomycetes bacterium]|nr:DUF1553 domain-containing protein [Planctomycetota bacterium]
MYRVAFSALFAFAGALSAQESKTTPKNAAIPRAEAPRATLQTLTVYPPNIDLAGPRDEQRIGVVGHFADGRTWELTRSAKYSVGNPKIAEVDANGIVRPVGNGQTTITINTNGKSQSIPVKVTKATADIPVSFSREISPILTRAGCNQGACHGSQHGRGGFKLSLLGFDPVFDHPQIVQSAEGRRVVLSDPERSIFIMKPALLMEHGGGEKIKVNSREYTYFKRWLEDGAPEPSRKDPEVASIEVWPPHRILVPGEEQQILVKATWKDGKVEDVTATAQFNSLNDGVAVVSQGGLVTAKGRGETHIMVRFMGQATVAQITLPYSKFENFPKLASNNFIDDKLIAKWKDLGLTPSPLAADDEFFRRIHLDAIGTLPTPAAIKAFLADKSLDRRAKAIDKVLDRPEFVDFWALKWGDLLRINRNSLNERGMWSFHNWVRANLRDNKPIDEMVRDIVTAEGSTYTEGPANFFMTANNAADWAETTSQLFLGVRIGCAKCHHHPFEKWSQDDYYSMAAFFVRLGTKASQEFGIFGRERVVYLKSVGEQSHPRRGGLVKPRPLDGEEMNDPIDRRVKLAEWLTAPKNPFFAKNIVNRFWGYTMGRGLVEPLDDMRATNPASNPELLDALAADFVKSKYSLKHLLRTIMNSRAYQLSSIKIPSNEADAQNIHYTRFTVRRLTAEQMADALDYATGTREKYAGLPLGTRAIQLPDSAVKSYLLDVFGRPARQITCECERTTQPNIAQAMHLLNGDVLNKKIANPTGRIEAALKAKRTNEQIIEELYLVTLSRMPNQDEIDRAQRFIREAPTPREGLQDVLWALVNSREYLFNH